MYIIQKTTIDPTFGKFAWYFRDSSEYYNAGFTNWRILGYLKIFSSFLFITVSGWIMKLAIEQIVKRQKTLPNKEQVRRF